MSNDRQLAIDAVDILNDFIGDLITGVMVFREYREYYRKGEMSLSTMVPIQKMCFSHLVLTLAKWLEFYDHYNKILPDGSKEICRSLNKKIRGKNIRGFRNTCIGHIWDKKLNRPLMQSEIMSKLKDITGEKADDFLKWINDPPNNQYPETVVSVVEEIRDSLVQEYGIIPSEVIDR